MGTKKDIPVLKAFIWGILLHLQIKLVTNILLFYTSVVSLEALKKYSCGRVQNALLPPI